MKMKRENKNKKKMPRNNSNWLGLYMMQVGVINTIYHKLLFAQLHIYVGANEREK